MSGEGVIPGIARLRARHEPPRFDQRPGELEATRGLPPVAVAGQRGAAGWQVVLMAHGLFVAVSPAEARALAAELVDYADRLEFGHLDD